MKRILRTVLTAMAAMWLVPALALADAPQPAPQPDPALAPTAPVRYAWSASAALPASKGAAIRNQRYGPREPQTWGWCGIIEGEEGRSAFQEEGRAKVFLFCGGPKYDSKPKWGLRHIQRYHEGHWEGKAVGTNSTWRQLADVSIAAALADPFVRAAGPTDR